MNIEEKDLPIFITTWLDQHPQFLNDYLRKLQLQRRNIIMNDETGKLLANTNYLYSNLRLQSHCVLDTPTSSSTKRPASIARGSSVLQEVEHLFQNDDDDDDENLINDHFSNSIKKRKQFKELGLYEKMYALVKALYQSLDLKTTCKKILKTVSLLLDADRCVCCCTHEK